MNGSIQALPTAWKEGLKEAVTVHRLGIGGVLREILVLKKRLNPPRIQQKEVRTPRSRSKLVAGSITAPNAESRCNQLNWGILVPRRRPGLTPGFSARHREAALGEEVHASRLG
jgi:hypothetical protein